MYRGPDVLPEIWKSDLANVLDDDIAESIAQECDSPRCHSCCRNLHGEALYIETVALAERLGLSDETIKTNHPKDAVTRFGGSMGTSALTAELNVQKLTTLILRVTKATPILKTFSRYAGNAATIRPIDFRAAS